MSARERKKPYARESAWGFVLVPGQRDLRRPYDVFDRTPVRESAWGLCWYPASAIRAALAVCCAYILSHGFFIGFTGLIVCRYVRDQPNSHPTRPCIRGPGLAGYLHYPTKSNTPTLTG